MSLYLLKLQQDEIFEARGYEIRNEYAKSLSGHLHKKKIKKEKDPLEKFKKMKMMSKDIDGNKLTNHCIYSVISELDDRNAINDCYDYMYTRYINDSITPDEWNCCENLIRIRLEAYD